MIYFSDEIVLARIQTQNAYFDRKSKEQSTAIIKPKYKLAGNVLLDIYTFFVLTSKEQFCQRFLTLKILKKDWEQKEPQYLEGCSFLDIKRVEVLNKDDILAKSRDRYNGFKQVARLCNEKFDELKRLKDKVHQSFRPVPEPIKNLIYQALKEINPADQVIRKLKLN